MRVLVSHILQFTLSVFAKYYLTYVIKLFFSDLSIDPSVVANDSHH